MNFRPFSVEKGMFVEMVQSIFYAVDFLVKILKSSCHVMETLSTSRTDRNYSDMNVPVSLYRVFSFTTLRFQHSRQSEHRHTRTHMDGLKKMETVLLFLLPLRVKVENNQEASKQYKETKIS